MYHKYKHAYNMIKPCLQWLIYRNCGLTVVFAVNACFNVFQVSQGDATEKLADQVPTETFAAYRRLEKTPGDTHAQEKDETHKSSKGHVSGKYGCCCLSQLSLRSTT